MKSLFALALGLSLGLCCDFKVDVYMDPSCQFYLQSKDYKNQSPGQCSSGNNADYPYYTFSCSGDSITLTYFKGAGCTGSSASENYKLGQCGTSAVNGGVYVKASSNDLPGCCNALNHPLDPEEIPEDSGEGRYGHEGEEPKHPEDHHHSEEKEQPLGHRGEKPHGFDPHRELEKLLHMLKHNAPSRERSESSSSDEERLGHKGEEPKEPEGHENKPLGHRGEEPIMKNPKKIFERMKAMLLKHKGEENSESGSESSEESEESESEEQHLGHRGEEPGLGFPFPHMPGFGLRNRMMMKAEKKKGLTVKGTKEHVRETMQAAMGQGPGLAKLLKKKDKLMKKLMQKEQN